MRYKLFFAISATVITKMAVGKLLHVQFLFLLHSIFVCKTKERTYHSIRNEIMALLN
jgi:hypothetical protein